MSLLFLHFWRAASFAGYSILVWQFSFFSTLKKKYSHKDTFVRGWLPNFCFYGERWMEDLLLCYLAEIIFLIAFIWIIVLFLYIIYTDVITNYSCVDKKNNVTLQAQFFFFLIMVRWFCLQKRNVLYFFLGWRVFELHLSKTNKEKFIDFIKMCHKSIPCNFWVFLREKQDHRNLLLMIIYIINSHP